MSRSLTAGLTNAVNAKVRRPYISCTIEDRINHLNSSVSASNSDAYNDCTIADDGAIIRVRVTRGASAFAQNAQWQRITDPTVGSQWTTWTTFGGGSANVFQDAGCAVSNNGGGAINAYFQRGTGGNDLWNWFSSDGGVTWSAGPGTVLVLAGSALIKGISSAGNSDVFFQYDVSGGDAIGCSFYSGGWSALATWTLPTVQSAQGLAVYWTGSLYYIAYSDGYALKECTSNSTGATWVALPDIANADSTALGRISPRIAKIDNIYNLICVEADSGFLTGSVYSYARLRQSKDLLHWSNGRIFQDVTTTFGVNFIKNTAPSQSRARYILVAMTTIKYNNAYQQSDQNNYFDASSSITEYKRIDQLDKPGGLEIVLDNANNALISYISDYLNTSYEAIGINTLVTLNEGYYTGSPPTVQETVNVGKYHIKLIEFERSPGISQIRLHCRDLTYLLDQESRFQTIYTSKDITWLITEITAKAGMFDISLPATSQMSTTITSFTLHAGQPYRRAINELCRIGWLEYFLDQTETLKFKELASEDASVWTYEPEIEKWSIGTNDIQGNHVIVTGRRAPGGPLGNITTGEAYDNVHAHAVGFERLIMVHDQKLGTAGLCEDAAGFIMDQEHRDQYDHVVKVPANPALQLLDPITTTDTGVQSTGIDNVSRVIRQEVRYNPGNAVYEMEIHLEGV